MASAGVGARPTEGEGGAAEGRGSGDGAGTSFFDLPSAARLVAVAARSKAGTAARRSIFCDDLPTSQHEADGCSRDVQTKVVSGAKRSRSLPHGPTSARDRPFLLRSAQPVLPTRSAEPTLVQGQAPSPRTCPVPLRPPLSAPLPQRVLLPSAPTRVPGPYPCDAGQNAEDPGSVVERLAAVQCELLDAHRRIAGLQGYLRGLRHAHRAVYNELWGCLDTCDALPPASVGSQPSG